MFPHKDQGQEMFEISVVTGFPYRKPSQSRDSQGKAPDFTIPKFPS